MILLSLSFLFYVFFCINMYYYLLGIYWVLDIGIYIFI